MRRGTSSSPLVLQRNRRLALRSFGALALHGARAAFMCCLPVAQTEIRRRRRPALREESERLRSHALAAKGVSVEDAEANCKQARRAAPSG